MKIEINDALESEDRQRLMFWREQVFPVEGRGMQWAHPRFHLVAREGGLAAGHIGFDGFTVLCDGTPLTVVGVGGVVVHPDYQGQGVPKLMFEHLRKAAPELTGSSIYTLFCPERLTGYYQKHGFELFTGPVSFMQNNALVPMSQFCFMYSGAESLGDEVALTGNPW